MFTVSDIRVRGLGEIEQIEIWQSVYRVERRGEWYVLGEKLGPGRRF